MGSASALGSIGQYGGQFETIERLSVENCFFDNPSHAVTTQGLLQDVDR
ncbi:hypothetical protein CTA2_9439 [Colletotrichum tanaceti]|nr:hypothetical protein CTA2_9439 [Colletotrichum tanaceti]